MTPEPRARGAAGRPPAPWFVLRDLLRSKLSHQQASDLGDAFARLAPLRLQRACERQFDFPVARVVRSSPLLLIRVPKTASVSLSLQVYGQVSHVPHRSAAFYRAADPEFYRAADPEFFARCTSFAVVRDPWERAASAYRWLSGRGNEFAAPDRRGRASVTGVDGFERFVLDVLEPAAAAGRLRRLDPVLHRQCDYVCDAAGRVIVDRLFRLERMGEVQAFLAGAGVLGEEVRANATARGSGGSEPSARSASPAVCGALGRIYARDAALFGYRPPDPRP